MPDPNQTVRSVAWQELFPWFLLFRCWGLSLTARLLGLATVAVILSPLGSWVGSRLFLPAEVREAVSVRDARVWPRVHPAMAYRIPQSPAEVVSPAMTGADIVFHRSIGGWQDLLTRPRTWGETAYRVLGVLWTLAVWSLFAGAITRIAVLQLGCDQRTTTTQALRFVLTRFRSYFVAPLLPMTPLILGLFILSVIGWIGQSGFGLMLVGLAWPIILVFGVILTLLMLGLALGWPLMWVALAAEMDADAFEAVSRAYTYALQRPMRLIGYIFVATLVGMVGWVVVYHVSEILIGLTTSGLSSDVFVAPAEDGVTSGTFFQMGAFLIMLGNGLIRTVAAAYGFSFFFCSATAIYLLLRRDIDEAQFDQVFDDRQDEESLELPPLPADILPSVPGDSSTPTSGPQVSDSSVSDSSDRDLSDPDGANRDAEVPRDVAHHHEKREDHSSLE